MIISTRYFFTCFMHPDRLAFSNFRKVTCFLLNKQTHSLVFFIDNYHTSTLGYKYQKCDVNVCRNFHDRCADFSAMFIIA